MVENLVLEIKLSKFKHIVLLNEFFNKSKKKKALPWFNAIITEL